MYKKLSEFCFLKGGSGFPERYQGSPEGEIPFIKVSDMNSPGNERFITTAHHYISLSDAKLLNAAVFNAGTIVFAKVGAALLLNRRRILTGPTIIDNNMMAAIPLDVDAKFLYHFLCSVDFAELVQSGALPSVNQDQVGRIKFPDFSKQTQKKIATILTSIDTAIEKTEALIAKYQQIKAGLMHDLFTRGVLPNGKLRPPRSQAPELYQETAIGWVPKSWKVISLRTCLSNSPTNGIYKSADQIGEEGILMVGQTAFTADRSVDFSLCRRGKLSVDDIRRYSLEVNDILVTRVFATVQGVGLPTLVPKLPESAVFESNMMRLQINQQHISPEFLFEWLRSPVARKYIHAGANASNQCSVNQSVLNPLSVPYPDKKEQERLVARFRQIDKYILSERDSLDNFRKQKIGLMQNLLTGKVPVQVDQPDTEVTA